MAEHTPTPSEIDRKVTKILEGMFAEDLNPAMGLALRLELREAGLSIVADQWNEALVKALQDIAAIPNYEFGGDWDEIDQARTIAHVALAALSLSGADRGGGHV